MPEIALIGDEIFDKAGERLPRGLGEVQCDLDRLDPLQVHPIENLGRAVRERVDALTRDVDASTLQYSLRHVNSENGDDREQDTRNGA